MKSFIVRVKLIVAMALLISGVASAQTYPVNKFHSEVTTAFQKEDFDGLETLYKIGQSHRTDSGLPLATRITEGIKRTPFPKASSGRVSSEPLSKAALEAWMQQELNEFVAFRTSQLETVTRWQRKYPNSSFATAAQAELELRIAWAQRGSGYAADVTPAAWKKFYSHVRNAAEVLRNAKTVKDPMWYAMMLDVSRLDRERTTDLQALAKEATDKFPEMYDFYFIQANYLVPQWGGNWQALAKFIEDSVSKTKEREGEALRARIYWSTSSYAGADFFKNTQVSWPKLKSGFEAVVARYPDPRNFNAFARFACLAKDSATAKKALTRIGAEPEQDVWLGGYTEFVACQKLAGL